MRGESAAATAAARASATAPEARADMRSIIAASAVATAHEDGSRMPPEASTHELGQQANVRDLIADARLRDGPGVQRPAGVEVLVRLLGRLALGRRDGLRGAERVVGGAAAAAGGAAGVPVVIERGPAGQIA